MISVQTISHRKLQRNSCNILIIDAVYCKIIFKNIKIYLLINRVQYQSFRALSYLRIFKNMWLIIQKGFNLFVYNLNRTNKNIQTNSTCYKVGEKTIECFIYDREYFNNRYFKI